MVCRAVSVSSSMEMGNVTDRDARISNALVEWDRLDDDDKNKDREQIAAIPGALLKIKRGIYR